MLTRPLTVDSDPRGRGLVAGTVPPALPLADEGDDDERHTGVFSHPAPPWSSSSSSSCPPPPPCASSSSSASSVTPSLSFLSSPSLTLPLPTLPPLCPPPLSSPPPVSLLSPLASVSPPPPVSPSLHSSAPSTHPSPVVFTSYTPPPPSSLFSSLSSSSNMSSSLPPPPPAPHCVSSTQYFSPSPPFPSSSSTPSISIIPDLSSVLPLPSSNFHPSPPSLSLHSGRTPPSLASSSISCSPLPPTSPCDSPPFSCASASFSSLLYHHSSFVSPPPPTPPFFTPCIPYSSALSSPLPSSSPPVHPSHLSPPLPPPTAPFFPPAPPPCCPCTTLLPRLLSAHRLEMRRLLRGALASLGHRLDSLERRCRRKMRKKRSRPKGEEEGAACSPGLAVFPLNSASSCSPAHLPPVTFSSSSDSEDTPAPQESSSLSQSQQKRTSREEGEGEGRRRKRKRKNYREREMSVSPENRKEEEEVDSGRFVGRMVVSFRGGAEQEEAPLTLHNFNNRKQRKREGGGTNQSEKAVSVVRQNGYRVPLLRHSPSSSSSQNALHFLQSAQSGQSCSQSKALSLSSGQWHFSGFTTPLTLSSNHSAFHLWLCSSSILFSPAPMLRLSAVTVETISESVIGGVSESPLRPLKDWTAPPSLSSDHCYMRTPTPSPAYFARRQQKQRASHNSRRLHLPRRLPLPLPLCSANGVSAQLPMSQSAAASEFLSTNRERCKRVSQIRIRRASPRETPLTPMGLPKVKRLKKKEFSLEEIYTNKNYKSPTTNRSLETIFEEPREKDGALLLIGQQRRRRILLFPDFTQPRKRKKLQGVGLPVAMVPRKRTAARRHCHGGGTDDDESDLDVMLVKRLSALEDFLTRQGLDM